MGHLAADDVVDVLDGQAGVAATRHAEQCPACRALVDEARRAMALASSDQIPEPSPLFWTQFSARVGTAIRRAPAPARTWGSAWWGWRAVPVGSLLVLVTFFGITQWQSGQPVRDQSGKAVVVPVAERPTPGLDLAADDAPWVLISQLFEDVAADQTTAVELPTAIGSADRAVESLSVGEKAELARLLRAALDESGISP